MGIPEVIAAVIGSVAFTEFIRWITTRGKTKRDFQAADMSAAEHWDRINSDRFETVNRQLRELRQDAELCRRRCDRYGDLTLDLLDILATHGVSEIEQYRTRYREIRDLGRAA